MACPSRSGRVGRNALHYGTIDGLRKSTRGTARASHSGRPVFAARVSRRASDPRGSVREDRDGLYDNVRLSEDVGVEEGLFDENERRSGPNGGDLENEKRWLEQHPHPQREGWI